MAADYTIVTQYETVEFLGGTQTRPVIAVGVRTTDHGIYFETRIDKADYTATVAKENAHGFTIIYEMLFDIPGVTDVEWAQEPNTAGILQDHVIVYVESTSGASSQSIDVPYSKFTQDYVAGKVRAIRAQMDEAEAG